MKDDNYTSTVDGAAGYERMRSMGDYNRGCSDDWNYYPDEPYEETDEDEEPECNCSDPGCPCRGTKRGGL